MFFDQIAFRVMPDRNFKRTTQYLNNIYGLDPEGWLHDEVVAQGNLAGYGNLITNKAHLAFNYSGKLEIEVIEYLDGPNFHKTTDSMSNAISHFGIHMNTQKEWLEHNKKLSSHYPLVQKVHTISHTNHYLIQEKRTYEYAIYDTRRHVGQFTKLIKRIERAGIAGESSGIVSAS